MKKVLVLYWRTEKRTLNFNDRKYRESFEYLTAIGMRRGLTLLFSDLNCWNTRKNAFTKYSFFDGKRWVKRENETGLVPDLIFDKLATVPLNAVHKEAVEKKVPFVNPLLFQTLLRNKYVNYLLFEDFYPKSYLISSDRELKKKANLLRTNKLVLKPISGTGGKKVKILKVKDILKKRMGNKPLLLQEFIDSSRGIEGIARGVHDLRVTIVGEKISYAYVRTPKKGGLLCNISQGGKMRIIKNNEIPKNIRNICNCVIKKFSSFRSLIYAIDFAIDRDGKAKIIEMNSMPGIYFYPRDSKYRDSYYKQLVENFLEHSRENSGMGI